MMLTRGFHVDGALVTITTVDVDEDLLHARVKLGIIPGEKAAEVMIGLERVRGKFQHQLVKKLRIKHVPHIAFEVDRETSK